MDASGFSLYQACLLHAQAERNFRTLTARFLSEWNISKMEWLVLAALAEPAKHDEGHTMKELACELDIKLSQLTPMSVKMNNDGLIAQKIAASDRRNKYMSITAKGRKLLEESEKGIRAALNHWTVAVPPKKIVVYLEVLEQLANARAK